jgi:pyrroline-5-carboxylate reductase
VPDQYDYGVLGVGEIGSAIVTGLCAEVSDPPGILLSPRGAATAARLAERYPSVRVAPDNQLLADRCVVVLVSVRPQDAAAVLSGLRFRPGQAVVSMVAGLAHEELAPLVSPALDIARAIPLPPVARRTGVTPVYPGTAAARALFGRLGGSVTVADVVAFEAMSVASGTIAAHLRYLAVISTWLSGLGVAPEDATRYVSGMFAGVAGELGAETGFDALARAHSTPGGINERFSRLLTQGGVFETVRESLQAIYQGMPGAGGATG